MGKIKAWYRSIPLWLAIFLFTAVALAAASFVTNKVTSAATAATIRYIQLGLEAGGPLQMDSGGLSVETDTFEQLLRPDQFTEVEIRQYHTNRFIARYAPVFIYSISLLTAVLLFYFTKLKRPLALLLAASKKIARNEFDFSLNYSGHDEMAKLCGAFEKMRSSLDEYALRTRQMIEERKQLNDAYTHDIRTPIAVLKGYTGILTRFLPTGQLSPERVLATVHTMEAHVERLEQFANSMNTAQKLADVTISREWIGADPFVDRMREAAAILCGKKNLSCRFGSRIGSDTLHIDPLAVTQVFENLLSNAARFANTEVTVQLEADGEALRIRVADDGRGFTGKELSCGTRPYFSGGQTEETYHFGLGLYICKTLCEKHGGSLTLANGENGGACVTSSFAL